MSVCVCRVATLNKSNQNQTDSLAKENVLFLKRKKQIFYLKKYFLFSVVWFINRAFRFIYKTCSYQLSKVL